MNSKDKKTITKVSTTKKENKTITKVEAKKMVAATKTVNNKKQNTEALTSTPSFYAKQAKSIKGEYQQLVAQTDKDKRNEIKAKEEQIKKKQEAIDELEDHYDGKMKELQQNIEDEKKKKADL